VALIALPGAPVMDAQTEQNLRDLTARGIAYEEKPAARPYGIDSSFRDPSGNTIRVTQPPAFSA